ncbi:MAG: ATP-binding protein [Candidatus Cloacimonetes bacterium]|nr:ATP-binding protein [Candidatus Cloacimonadota bacterium]
MGSYPAPSIAYNSYLRNSCLDEIQLIKNLPSIVKYLYDHYQVKFFLTGSASFYLKNLFSESLAGRKFIFELFPLTFKEFLIFKGSKFRLPKELKNVSRVTFELFLPLYEEYLTWGAFPGVVLKSSKKAKEKALDDIFSSYFQKEIIQLGDFKDIKLIRDFVLLLAQRVGSKLDISKIASELSTSRPTIYEYLAFLEGTYFIKTIRPFSKSRDVEIKSAPKLYFCDSGLLGRIAKLEEGKLFENAIFNILKLRGNVNYYQRKTGVEIDFILDKKSAFEVKLGATRQDLKRIAKVASSLELSQYFLVAKNYSQLENVTYGFNL